MTLTGCQLQNVIVGRNWYARLGYAGDVVDLDYPPFFIDRVEDAVPPGPQAPQIRRPVGERLRRPRLIGELANSVPEHSDTDGIVAKEARRLVQRLNLPVDLVAHRDGMPRRRPASSCDTYRIAPASQRARYLARAASNSSLTCCSCIAWRSCWYSSMGTTTATTWPL